MHTKRRMDKERDAACKKETGTCRWRYEANAGCPLPPLAPKIAWPRVGRMRKSPERHLSPSDPCSVQCHLLARNARDRESEGELAGVPPQRFHFVVHCLPRTSASTECQREPLYEYLHTAPLSFRSQTKTKNDAARARGWDFHAGTSMVSVLFRKYIQ